MMSGMAMANSYFGTAADTPEDSHVLSDGKQSQVCSHLQSLPLVWSICQSKPTDVQQGLALNGSGDLWRQGELCRGPQTLGQITPVAHRS